MKKRFSLLLAVTLLLTLAACGTGKPQNGVTAVTTTKPAVTSTAATAASTTHTEFSTQTTIGSTGAVTTAVTKPEKIEKTTAPPSKTTAPESTEKKGTVIFSDDADNAFVKAVADKYGADTSLLAAIYYVPPSDSNVVLQFNGSKDNGGKLIRNGSTLKYIYTLDASHSVKKRASENPLENEGCGTGESIQMFFTVKKWLIPKFETELS